MSDELGEILRRLELLEQRLSRLEREREAGPAQDSSDTGALDTGFVADGPGEPEARAERGPDVGAGASLSPDPDSDPQSPESAAGSQTQEDTKRDDAPLASPSIGAKAEALRRVAHSDAQAHTAREEPVKEEVQEQVHERAHGWAAEPAPPPQPRMEAAYRPQGVTTPGGPVRASGSVSGAGAGKKPPQKRTLQNLEQVIGGKIFAVIGPLIVLAGLAFGVKIAWDAGYLHVSETVRCVLVALFGVVMIGAGEVARKELGKFASGGITAIGIGSLYIAAWGAYGLYGLIPPPVALLLMGLTAMLGLALSVRAQLPVVAALSLIGGYAAPLLARTPDPSPYALPLYVIALTVVGLGLSVWRERFSSLRTVCWWSGGLLATLWMYAFSSEQWDTPLLAAAFALVLWMLFHLELLVSCRRMGLAERAGGHAAQTRFVGARELGFSEARPLVASASTTAWSAAWLATALERIEVGGSGIGWVGPAILAGGCLYLWLVWMGGIGLLRRVPTTSRERLGTVFAFEAGALIIFAVAIGVSGWLQTASWIGMGVAACYAGRRIRADLLTWYGLVVLGLALGRVFTIDSYLYDNDPVTVVQGLSLTRWALLPMVLGVGLLAAGLCTLQPGKRVMRVCAHLAHGLSVPVFASGVLGGDSEPLAIVLVWVMLGFVGLVGYRFVGLKRGDVMKLRGGQIGAWVLLVLAALVPLMGMWFNRKPVWAPIGLAFSDLSLGMVGVGIGFVASAWMCLRVLRAEASDALVEHPGGVGARSVPLYETVHVFGLVCLLLAIVHTSAAVPAMIIAWCVAACVLPLLDRVDVRARSAPVGGLAWVLALGAWSGAYFPEWTSSELSVFLHPAFWLGLLLAGVAPWVTRQLGWTLRYTLRDEKAQVGAEANARLAGWGSLVVVLFITTSYEIARSAGILIEASSVERGALSVWWALYGVGLIVGGSVLRIAPARYAGLGLVAVVAAKVLLFDLVGLSPAVRAVSFIVVGLLIVGVAAGYLRLRRGGAMPGSEPAE